MSEPEIQNSPDRNDVYKNNSQKLIYQNIGFTGNASEYFGIWIVNVILSIVTLGIYSAWAKVRRETYFKNNTKIADNNFGYHATGGQILKGRLIAFAVIVVFNILSTFLPMLGAAIIFILFFIIPWAINKSMKFSARMTSFRNIRFNWHGTYLGTFWFLVIAPVLSILSLGLLLPLISKSYYSYFARSHSYGTSSFLCQPRARDFYYAYLIGSILPTLFIGFLTFIFFIVVIKLTSIESFFPALFASLYVLGFSLIFIYPVMSRNLMINYLLIKDFAKFESNINPFRFVWIALSNLLMVLFSFGLLLPLAQIRMYKYLANCTKIKVHGDIDKFFDKENTTRSSFGEEFAELEGIEVSI